MLYNPMHRKSLNNKHKTGVFPIQAFQDETCVLYKDPVRTAQ